MCFYSTSLDNLLGIPERISDTNVEDAGAGLLIEANPAPHS